MEINTSEAARFLAALSGDATYTFQTFDDAKQGRRGLTRVLHGAFADKGRVLADLNRKGAGVFVMVNRGDGAGRQSINVLGCRALFVDLDGAPLDPVLAAPIAPRIVVESSPGKWHAYWPVVDLPLEQFTAAQKALAAAYGGDLKVHDRPRVMRLPGFVHRKGAPFVSRLVTCDDAPLTWQEVCDAFGLNQRMVLPSTIPNGERNSTLFKLARSAAAKGVPEAEELAKLQKVNAERCSPPLPASELAQIVTSGYRSASDGQLAIPLAVIDSDAYKGLDDAARTLVLLAYRRADKFGSFALPWSEMAGWFKNEDTFYDTRKRVVKSGLMQVTKEAVNAMPRKGRGPKPTFFRLAIPPISGGYSAPSIPPISGGPEALQAVAVEAFEGGEPIGRTENPIEKPIRRQGGAR